MAARRATGRGVRVQAWPEEVGPELGAVEGGRCRAAQAWRGGRWWDSVVEEVLAMPGRMEAASRPKIGHRPTSEVKFVSVYIWPEQDRPQAVVRLIRFFTQFASCPEIE